jgi:3-oxoacyl-[acyl-carrier-protein] synthase I
VQVQTSTSRTLKTVHAQTPIRIPPIQISAYTATSAVGVGKEAMLMAVVEQRSGLRANNFGHEPFDTWIGRVAALDETTAKYATPVLPERLTPWDCRNHRLAWLGLNSDGFMHAVAAARKRFGAARIAVLMGTTTSSIGATEDAYRQLDSDGQFPQHLRNTRLHTPHSLSTFVQEALDLTGPNLTVMTACSSSAKVFATAERMLRLNLIDAAVVGGVDTLCGSVLFGFNALQLVSSQPCRPFDVGRSGINLGEAAGFVLLERATHQNSGLQLIGYGESSDAHHMSTPHPLGLGAEFALNDALSRAAVTPQDVDHINLHGTASTKNDEVEAALVARRFGTRVHASSTKGLTGHALGAAGVLDAAFTLLALESGWMPGTHNTQQLDPLCGPQIRLHPAQADVRIALSHSFGFGGSNCVLVFARADTQ